jgi:hypothetical protein
VNDTALTENAENVFSHTLSHIEVLRALEKGKGWKEFRFVSPSHGFLTFVFSRRDPSEVGQMAGMLRKRDGEDSGAFVKMYVSSLGSGSAGRMGSVMNLETRQEYDLAKAVKEIEYDSRMGEMVFPLRETMVVVRRGDGVDYAEDGQGISERVRTVFEAKSWLEIKEEKILKA